MRFEFDDFLLFGAGYYLFVERFVVGCYAHLQLGHLTVTEEVEAVLANHTRSILQRKLEFLYLPKRVQLLSKRRILVRKVSELEQ